MPIIRVTGLLEVDDDEIDDGPLGPLTADAHERYSYLFMELDDIEYEEVDDQG